MANDATQQSMIDKFEIIENSTYHLNCRDSGNWLGLANCYHPDAHITTSWFNGAVRDFVAQSKAMMEGHHEGDTQRHVMSNPHVTINGNRAICEFYVILHQGRTLDGYEFDLQTWSVTLDLYEKRGDKWGIVRRSNIYEKERMDPHVPGSVPQSYYDSLDLSKYPKALRFHCYRNERSSGHAPKNLIMKGSPEEAAARKKAEDWLEGK